VNDPADPLAGSLDATPAEHYDRVTPAWNLVLGDDFHHGLFTNEQTDLGAATRELTGAMAAAAAPPLGGRIVDLGCGTGAQACWLARRYAAAHVVGVTTSSAGVAEARARAAAAGCGDVTEFLCADARDTGLPDGAFDVVWLLESSQYLPPRPALMRECARLLAPHGRLVLCDVMLARGLELRDLRRLHRELDALRRVFGEAVMGTVEEYRSAAQAVGLRIDLEQELTQRVLPTFASWRDRARQAQPQLAQLVGEAWLPTFLEGCDVMERLFEEGIVVYRLLAAQRPSDDHPDG
jgi:27-O-demethylrifamycin SV methyltransferase